jgi:tetratricopeptide (TPR) repeat protein
MAEVMDAPPGACVERAGAIARIAAGLAGGGAGPLGAWLRAHPDLPAAVLCDLGDEFFRAGARAGAAEFYRRLREAAAPPSLRVHAEFKLGQIAKAQGDAASALGHFEAAARLDPTHPAIAFDLASALRHTPGRAQEAQEMFETFPWPPAYAARVGVALGRAAQARGDHAAAAGHFAQAFAAQPDDLELLADSIGNHLAAGEAGRALERLSRHHAAHPPTALSLRLQGKAHLAARESEAAARAFAQACRLAPDDWACWTDRAAAALDSGDFAAARACAGTAAQLAPNMEAPRRILAESHRREGDFAGYVEALEQAAASSPAAIRSRLDLLIQRLALARPAAAPAEFARAGPDISADAACLVELARHALIDLQADAALKLLSRAERIGPVCAATKLVRAQALFQKGDPAAARAALEPDPGAARADPALRLKACELLLAQGDHGAALALLRQGPAGGFRETALAAESLLAGGDVAAAEDLSRRLVPFGAEERLRAAMLEARVLEARGDPAAAARRLEQAAALAQGHAGVLTERLRLAIRTGQREQARHVLDRLRQHDRSLRGHGKVNGRPWDLAREILVEWELDDEAGSALDAALALDDESARAGALAAALREAPDYTPLALHYLRCAGCARPPRAPGAGIPPTIYQFWRDGRLPADLEAYARSVGEANPGCRRVLLDEAGARRLLEESPDRAVLAAYLRAREIAQKADVLRLALLWRRGGWYVDIDTRGHAPLASLQRGPREFVGYFDPFGAIANDVIGAAPGHPAVGRALRAATESILRGDRDSVWLCTGPGALTRAVAGWLASDRPRDPWRVNLLESTAVRPVVSSHCAAAYKMSNAHWSRSASHRSADRLGALWRAIADMAGA